MTLAQIKRPAIRPAGTVYEIDVVDSAGRTITYRVQVDARGVSCWTDTARGGRLTPPQLFVACVQARLGAK
jgi:hypothetical protein